MTGNILHWAVIEETNFFFSLLNKSQDEYLSMYLQSTGSYILKKFFRANLLIFIHSIHNYRVVTILEQSEKKWKSSAFSRTFSDYSTFRL